MEHFSELKRSNILRLEVSPKKQKIFRECFVHLSNSTLLACKFSTQDIFHILS